MSCCMYVVAWNGMNTACCSRRVPYSKWRLKIFTDLFALPEAKHLPIGPVVRATCRLQTQGARQYHTTAHELSRSTDAASKSREVYGNKGAYQNEEELSGKFLAGTSNTLTDGVDRNVSPGGTQARGRADSRRLRQNTSKQEIDPFSLQNSQELQASVQALTNMLEQLQAKQLEPGVASAPGDSIGTESFLPQNGPPGLPQSPVLRKTHKRRQPRKELRQEADESLRLDPWAQMLADPIRHCRSSDARLPKSLLSEWSLTRNSDNEEVYIVPNQLADVDAVERINTRKELQRRAEKSLQGDEKDMSMFSEEENPLDMLLEPLFHADRVQSQARENTAQSAHDGASSNPSQSPSSHHQGLATARLLLYENFLNFHSLNALRKKSGVMSSIIPMNWMTRVDEARHYEKNRISFEKATGEEDTAPGPLEGSLNIKTVKWQPDISERLMSILRKRVLVAFIRALEADVNVQDDTRRQVSTIKASKVIDLMSQRTSKPSPSVNPDTTATEKALDTRIFFHLGHQTSNVLTKSSGLTTLPLLPPLLPSPSRTRTQRFPIFPIRAMLGEKSYNEFIHLLRHNHLLRSDQITNLDDEGQDFLVMFHHRSREGSFNRLAREVWRLWRFGGGTRWGGENVIAREEEWREKLKPVYAFSQGQAQRRKESQSQRRKEVDGRDGEREDDGDDGKQVSQTSPEGEVERT